MFYLAQVVACTAAMLLIYGLFLRNRPLYRFSRLYLLACTVLPLFIPLLQMPAPVQQRIQNVMPAGFYLPAFTVSATNRIAATHWNTLSFWYGYAIVALLLIAWQSINAYKLWKVVSRSKKEKQDAYILVTNSGYGPGSVGRYILFPGEEVNETILAHEQAHIRLHHTRDLIFLNVLQAILWPNLSLIWIKKEIKEVHEFQADALINPDKQEYTQLLLASVFNTRSAPVMHSFINHPIKRRIMMLQKKGHAAPFKAAMQVCSALIVFICLAVGIQGCQKKAEVAGTADKSAGNSLVTVDAARPIDTPDNNGVYAHPDKMPQCTADLNAFFNQNLHYPDGARKEGIEGRVVVKFVVDEFGSLKHPVIMRSPDTRLSDETLRALNLMPKWTPGENNGKPVPVYFTLPVVFKLGN